MVSGLLTNAVSLILIKCAFSQLSLSGQRAESMNIPRITFESDKAIEATAVLLNLRHSHAMSRIRLMKLLYIANRKMLRQYGRPLFRCTMSAMKHGPVPSEVLTTIESGFGNPRWHECFQNDGYEVRMVRKPEPGALSEAEIEILSKTSDELGSLSDWDIVDATHQFPEWTHNYVEGTSRPIPLEDILKAIGMEAHTADILNELRLEDEFDQLFSS